MLRQAFLRFPSIPPLPNPYGHTLILRHYVQSSPHLFDRSSMAKQNFSHGDNVICNGSPSRIRMVRRISLGMTTRPRSSIRLTMPVAFIYQIPPVDANVAQIVSACQRPAMQIFPVSCFWKAAPRKNAHAARTRTNSLIWPLITSSFSCTIFSDIVCCLLSEWCVVTSFYQSLQAMSPFLLFSICATYCTLSYQRQRFYRTTMKHRSIRSRCIAVLLALLYFSWRMCRLLRY